MRILIIYIQYQQRKTIQESIECFGKYQHKYEVFYYNYESKIPILWLLKKFHFDIVIFHNTFLNLLWDRKKREIVLKQFNGLWKDSARGALFQDEYVYCNANCEFINSMDIDVVFSVFDKSVWPMLFPVKLIGKRKIVRVLTGYVDEETLKYISQMESEKRTIDIGYRANQTNYSLGRQGILKSEITEVFNKRLKNEPDIIGDIQNTIGTRNLFQGWEWYKFLKRCRTMVGCMGGSSIYDPEGKLYEQLLPYKYQKYTSGLYQRLEKGFINKYKCGLDITALSPRCFECAMTKTCQLLVEGSYNGIMRPGVHYIEVKRDFSNLDEVFEKVRDKEFCEKIADNAYEDLIASGKYTYRRFVRNIIRVMEPYERKGKKHKFTKVLRIFILLNNKLVVLKGKLV